MKIEAKCPGCGGETFRSGFHCLACLEKVMKEMTPEDWEREITAICDNVAGEPGP